MQATRDRRLARVRLAAEADGRSGLFEILSGAIGSVIAGRFELRELVAIGRESFVFLAEDNASGDRVAVKQPAFDYRRPISIDRAEVSRKRSALAREHRVLEASASQRLPRAIALEHAAPVIGSSIVFGIEELYLIEEWIDGRTITELALGAWRELAANSREQVVARLAKDLVELMAELDLAGWFYPDVSPGNLMLEASGALRVVDAGSMIERAPAVRVPGFTPAFTTPRLFARLSRGEPIEPGPLSVLPSIGKVLHFCLTTKEPVNGALPELGALRAAGISDLGAEAVEALIALDANPEAIDRAKDAVATWSMGC
jgi:serine/threonine protein kinase